MAEEPLIAVFVDFENLAIGVQEMKWGDFLIDLVLKRLLEKGRIVYKRAYGDWSRHANAAREFHSEGVDLIDIPTGRQGGKNSADIRMVVDALDLCYARHHIGHFALLSGDSDFTSLVSKLKENDKRVIGCGVKSSTSNLLRRGCDEFIFYDDLVRQTARPKRPPVATKKATGKKGDASDKKGEAIDRLLDIVDSLERDYDPLWGSLVKQTIRRVHPGFNEEYSGYAGFTALLEDAAARGLIELEYDKARGNYVVRLPRR